MSVLTPSTWNSNNHILANTFPMPVSSLQACHIIIIVIIITIIITIVIIDFLSLVDMFPREFKNWNTQNLVQIISLCSQWLASCHVTRQCCSIAPAPKLSGREKLLPSHRVRLRRSFFPDCQRLGNLMCSEGLMFRLTTVIKFNNDNKQDLFRGPFLGGRMVQVS